MMPTVGRIQVGASAAVSRKKVLGGLHVTTWGLFSVSMYYSSEALAASFQNTPIRLDHTEVFRWVITALLGIVLWYARKLDTKIEDLDRRVPQNLSRKLELLDGEDKNTQSLVLMLRDQVNKDHTTKAETAEHRRRIEDELREMRAEIRESNARQNERLEQLIQILAKRG